MDDCDAAAWWPDSAGERMTVVPLRRGGEAGVDELLRLRREGSGTAAAGEGDGRELELELVTEATRADASPVERCCFGEAVLVVELRRHRRRLRALVVDEMLAVSESRMRPGERNCDSGTEVLGLAAAMVNARACVGVCAEDVGEVRNSFVPVIDSTEEARTSPCPLLFARLRAGESSALYGSELMLDANCGPDGTEEEDAVGSMREREREDEREETTLRTRSRRLLADLDGANVRSLLSRPSVLLEVGVGVGIPLSDSGSGAVELLRLDNAAGLFLWPRSFNAGPLLCSL